MTEFFKKLGQGLLYTLVLPVLIVVLAGYSVYGIIIFLIMLVKSIVLFFKGKSLNTDLPEDIEAKRRLKALTNPFDNPAPAPEPREEKEPVVIIERPREENVMDIPPQRQELENKETNPYLICKSSYIYCVCRSCISYIVKIHIKIRTVYCNSRCNFIPTKCSYWHLFQYGIINTIL